MLVKLDTSGNLLDRFNDEGIYCRPVGIGTELENSGEVP